MIYKVINARHLRSLEAIVNLNIEDGWEPLGSLVCQPMPETCYPSKSNWCQPMVQK